MSILIVVALVIVALALAIATRPKTFRVERSLTIAAPAERIFPFVNDFHQWTLWSPFEKLDPNLQRTYSGAPSGVGATYAWLGNREAGEGTMQITASDPAKRIALDLSFLKPFKSTSVTEFTFAPTAGGTNVTWAMSGNNTLAGKAISLVASMDKFLGTAFNEGLSNLKRVSEAPTA